MRLRFLPFDRVRLPDPTEWHTHLQGLPEAAVARDRSLGPKQLKTLYTRAVLLTKLVSKLSFLLNFVTLYSQVSRP